MTRSVPERTNARPHDVATAIGWKPPKGSILGIQFDRFESTDSAARWLIEKARRRDHAIVVHTCNVDHVMQMQKDANFASAYRAADIVTVDGAPLVALGQILGRPIGPRITGADLVPALISEAERHSMRIALVGGTESSVKEAERVIRDRHPSLTRVLAVAPPMGFLIGSEADNDVVRRLEGERSQVVIVGLGAPKQELWMHVHRGSLPGTILIGAGAAIDFISGAQKRAPGAIRRIGLEWAYRLATDFTRLWRRYLVRDAGFALLVIRYVVKSAMVRR
jgi:N-acetylglucosaminyldiphosphoundecaprenol N-acetyl-beta-D-mannosaminyltransferase